MIATRDIPADGVILTEAPLVSGPPTMTAPLCLGCYKYVNGSYLCPKCNYPMCGPKCSESIHHQPECRVIHDFGVPITVDNFVDTHYLYESIFVLRCLCLRFRDDKTKWEQYQLNKIN